MRKSKNVAAPYVEARKPKPKVAVRKEDPRIAKLEKIIGNLKVDVELAQANSAAAQEMMTSAIERANQLRIEREAALKGEQSAQKDLSFMKPELHNLRARLNFAEGYIAACDGPPSGDSYINAIEKRFGNQAIG